MPERDENARERLPNGPGALGRGLGPRVLPHTSDDVASHFGPRLWDRMDLDPVLYAAASRLATAATVGGVHVLPAVQPADGAEPDARAEEAARVADFIRGMFAAMDRPLADVIQEMMRAAWKHGNKLAEPIEREGLVDGYRVLKEIAPKPHWAWKLRVDSKGRADGVVATDSTAIVDGRPAYPLDDFLILSWDVTDGDLRGRSLYRHVYRPWNYKAQSLPEHFAYVGRFASPAVSIEIDKELKGLRIDEYTDAGVLTGAKIPIEVACHRAAVAWRNGYALTLPPGCKVHVHEANGNGEAFLKGFTYYDQQMAWAVHHTARAVMQSERNSQADAGAAKDTEDDLLTWLGEWVAAPFARLAKKYVAINFGERAAREFAPIIRVGEMATADIAAEMAVAVQAGYTLHTSQFEGLDHRYGQPERAEGWDEEPEPVPVVPGRPGDDEQGDAA